MRLHSLVALSLVVAACTPKSDTPSAAAAPAALSAAELDSVKAVDAAFAAGVNAKDTTAVFKLYSPDAKVLPPDSPILDAAGGRAAIGGLVAAGATEMVLTPTITYGVGDLAYQVGTATWKMGGKPDAVKYSEVLRKESDGKWRYVVDMFSPMAPATPPAAAAIPAKK